MQRLCGWPGVLWVLGAASLVGLAPPTFKAHAATELASVQTPPEENGDEAMARYLGDLEKSGRLSAETATLAALKEAVIAAEDLVVHEDGRAATTLLYGLVEAPRFAPLRNTPTFQNAEYVLGRALYRGRAYNSAERYFVRLLRRGPTQPYFVPAFRAYVDLALDTHEHARVVAAIEALGLPALPADSAQELAYLRAKTAYDEHAFDDADAQFTQVSRASRLYPAATYLRGLIAARKGAFADARAAFCQIADQRAQDRVAFNVDSRFFPLKDLAHLALGRIAHEQNRYDEAYYYYFSVPEDSERLPEALFEASWSMFQKNEFRAARAFADQFDRLFPHSPLRADMAILRANLAVKTCAFDRARAEATALVALYAPIEKAAAQALADPERRHDLLQRLLSRDRSLGDTTDRDGQLLELLKLDDRFAQLYQALADLDVDIAEAMRGARAWRELGARARKAQLAQPATTNTQAVELVENLDALAAQAPPHSRLAHRIADLAVDAYLAAYPPADAGPYVAEARASLALARKLGALRAAMTDAAERLAVAAMTELDQRLRTILRQTRLVHIDAVVGKKKKLEIEIAGLNDGRIPPEMFRKMQAEGTIADDEIYWPFEGEMWSDEYENFR